MRSFVSVCGWGQVKNGKALVQGAEDNLPGLVLATWFGAGSLHCCVAQASWPEGFWGCSCLCFLLPVGMLGQDISATVAG